METPEHQEKRARERVRISAVVKAALLTGLVLFIMSGGGPWSTAGTMNVILGRDVPVGLPMLVLGHFGLSFVYVFVIAQVIYRFRPVTGILVGIAVAIALYGVNWLVFKGLGITQHSPESKTFFVHLVFGLLGSAIYKAFSVPRPRKSDGEPAA